MWTYGMLGKGSNEQPFHVGEIIMINKERRYAQTIIEMSIQ